MLIRKQTGEAGIPSVSTGAVGECCWPHDAESVYKPRVKPRRLPADTPNILIVLIDDAAPACHRRSVAK